MEREHNHNEKVMFMLGELSSDMKSTLAEVKKTNGRVSKLEEKTDEHGRFIDGVKTKVALVSGAVSLGGFLFWEFITNKYFK